VNKLGALEVPANQDKPTKETIRTAIAQAFVVGFRIVILICAGLALLSSLVAWRMIPSRTAEMANSA
jgi:hypothetical protein